MLNFNNYHLLKKELSQEGNKENIDKWLNLCFSEFTSNTTKLKALKNLEQLIRKHLSEDTSLTVPNGENVFSKLVELLESKNFKIQSKVLTLLSYLASNSKYKDHRHENFLLLKVNGLLFSNPLQISFKTIFLLNSLPLELVDSMLTVHCFMMVTQWLDRHQELLAKISTKKVYLTSDNKSSETLILDEGKDSGESTEISETANQTIRKRDIVLASLELLNKFLINLVQLNSNHSFKSIPTFKSLINFLRFEEFQPWIITILSYFINLNQDFKNAVLEQFYSKNNQAIREEVKAIPNATLNAFLQQLKIERFISLRWVDENNSEEALRFSAELHQMYSNEYFLSKKYLTRGGFGDIYQYLSPSSEKIVIIKQLQLHPNKKNSLIDFAREALIHSYLTYLTHANIITFLGVYGGAHSPGIVLEKAQSSLADRIDGTAKLPWSQRIRIAQEIASALTCVHHLSWLHGDIGSSNVLLMEDGTAKLSDFGLARPYPSPEKIYGGTIRYMAPEVINKYGGKYYRGCSLASDVYSFAVLLAELSSWKMPWIERVPKDAFSRQESNRVEELLRKEKRPVISEDAPEGYKEIVQGAWNTAPEKRYKISEVLEKLGAIKVDPPCPDTETARPCPF